MAVMLACRDLLKAKFTFVGAGMKVPDGIDHTNHLTRAWYGLLLFLLVKMFWWPVSLIDKSLIWP